jgi:hypothetical protein
LIMREYYQPRNIFIWYICFLSFGNKHQRIISNTTHNQRITCQTCISRTGSYDNKDIFLQDIGNSGVWVETESSCVIFTCSYTV